MAESDPGGPGCGRLEARQCPPQPTDGLADVRLPHVDAMTAARQHERGRRGGGVHGPAERLVTRPASPRTATCLCAEAKDIGLACASFTDASPARVRRRMSRRSPAPGMRCGRAFLAPIPSLCAWYAVWACVSRTNSVWHASRSCRHPGCRQQAPVWVCQMCQKCRGCPMTG